VRVAVVNGTTNAPNCAATFTGTTAESNNLNLGDCTPVGGATPAIVFSESGSWNAAPLPVSINNTLSFIKTANTPNGKAEVHLASGTSGYLTRTFEPPATTFVNESDGVWQLLPNQDLAFIKTSNTPSGQVEVHIASRASNYTTILETPTTFVNESDGVWQLLPSQDLAFIKTSNTPNGQVEVHIASRASNYTTRILETPTTFVNESDGVWQLLPNQDLAFIKTSNTPNGQVEVHIASRASNYTTMTLETPTTFANESDGVWALLVP
jgi:sulfur relay (sulfurtransferase) DsrF/TusC family protein